MTALTWCYFAFFWITLIMLGVSEYWNYKQRKFYEIVIKMYKQVSRSQTKYIKVVERNNKKLAKRSQHDKK